MLRKHLREAVVPFSPYYRERITARTINNLKSFADLQRLPFTRKRDLENPRDIVLQPEPAELARRPMTIARGLVRGPRNAKAHLEHEFRPVMMTSTTGRSGAPVPFVYSGRDLDLLSVTGTRMMEICESSPEFRHVNLFPYAPHLAFWQAHYAGTGFRTFMLSTGGGKAIGLDKNLQMVDRVNPDAVISMPTFFYHLLHQASENGLRWSNIKRVVLGGEKVPLGMRRKLHEMLEAMGAEDVRIMGTYGMTEAKMAWPECPAAPGSEGTGYHLSPDLVLVEVVDPESGVPVPEGHPGEIVVTPLQARGSVVVRYRTGDLISGGIEYTMCPHCGRNCPRLMGSISRVSNRKRLQIGKVKGTLVDFDALEVLLDDVSGLASWQIELRKHRDDPLETDEIVVYCVTAGGKESAAVERAVYDRFDKDTEIHPNEVRFVTMDELSERLGVGVALKEERVVDRRPQFDDASGGSENNEEQEEA
ncbi:AMP-binding protein [Sulfuriroseicoccus oceanibius]|uniref:AMP-binding protein n=2 Tax=Sulfuriroseicoccus oceanibius TaxID=2707525 RepID=A0A6B3L384_9BACT|nr:AMP-binding protein [Sulfuriroseicoccus oceanibius]